MSAQATTDVNNTKTRQEMQSIVDLTSDINNHNNIVMLLAFIIMRWKIGYPYQSDVWTATHLNIQQVSYIKLHEKHYKR